MGTKWRVESIRCIPEQISDEEFESRIAEVAQVLYQYFCQLQFQDRSLKPVESTSLVSESQTNQPIRRNYGQAA